MLLLENVHAVKMPANSEAKLSGVSIAQVLPLEAHGIVVFEGSFLPWLSVPEMVPTGEHQAHQSNKNPL